MRKLKGCPMSDVGSWRLEVGGGRFGRRKLEVGCGRFGRQETGDGRSVVSDQSR
ncbi:hypothetical protein [Algoriphagus vanfongensis]|uniref:hypothetical protein n=1 Tax=Algoriphagus vanfongensis TaxID=426371 RepID=UPI0012F73655|nr:hypothetical protein [Algoriphagus vanfongensis]